MARGLNRVIIIGSLGADPDMKYATSGTAICTLSVATNETWTDKQGQKQERTEWHRVKLFDKLAEIANEYLRKGALVYFEGKIRTDKYTDREGVERYATSILANEMQMLGGKREDSNADRRSEPPTNAGRQDRPARQHTQDPPDFPEDIIPF
jgi:single-strand DNA-binding protein